jgi:hypothetical protein
LNYLGNAFAICKTDGGPNFILAQQKPKGKTDEESNGDNIFDRISGERFAPICA